MAVTSPGEPFHIINSTPEWVLCWYPARNAARPLAGPPITDLIPEIDRADFTNALLGHIERFTRRVDRTSSLGARAYAVLTTCRALYTLRNGSQASKTMAAQWASTEFPSWAPLIQEALVCRENQWDANQRDSPCSLADVHDFIADMAPRAKSLARTTQL